MGLGLRVWSSHIEIFYQRESKVVIVSKKHSKIKISIPELLYPYSPTAKPLPPLVISDVCECERVVVRFSAAYVPYILGALELFRWQDAFYGTPEEKERTVGLFRDLMGVIAMASRDCGCDDGVITTYRVNPDTGQIEQSSDGGQTWTIPPDSPYTQATQLPPLSGDNGTAKRCEAANNVIGQLKEIQSRWSGWIGVITGLTDFLAQLLAEVIALLFVPEGNEGIAEFITRLLSKIYEVGKELFNTTSAAYDAMFTQQIWDNALCIVLCNVGDDGRFDDAGWSAIRSRFQNELNVGGNTAGSSLACMIDVLGTVGLNNAATLHNQSQAPCDDCTCANCSNLDDWDVIYGTISLQEPGHIRLDSVVLPSGYSACRLANYKSGAMPDCCFVTVDLNSSPVTNTSYTPCGSQTPINSWPTGGACTYDLAFTDVFGRPLTIDFYFSDCQ